MVVDISQKEVEELERFRRAIACPEKIADILKKITRQGSGWARLWKAIKGDR